MSEEIASLYAKIGADVSGFKQGMEQVKTSLTGIGGKIEGLRNSFTELNAAMGIATQFIGAVKHGYDAVITSTVSYAAQVRELSRLIGASAEESSKLIEIADDLGISYAALSRGMTAAIRQGLSPTVDGMAKLIEQYQALPTAIQRSEFLLKNFGRAGAELGPLFERSAESIRSMGEEAQRTGLTMSTEGVASARMYEMALDSLNDVIEGLKRSMWDLVGPGINVMLRYVKDFMSLSWGSDFFGSYAKSWEMVGKFISGGYAREYYNDLRNEIWSTGKGLNALAGENNDLASSASDASSKINEQAKAIQWVGSVSSTAYPALQKLADATKDISGPRYQWDFTGTVSKMIQEKYASDKYGRSLAPKTQFMKRPGWKTAELEGADEDLYPDILPRSKASWSYDPAYGGWYQKGYGTRINRYIRPWTRPGGDLAGVPGGGVGVAGLSASGLGRLSGETSKLAGDQGFGGAKNAAQGFNDILKKMTDETFDPAIEKIGKLKAIVAGIKDGFKAAAEQAKALAEQIESIPKSFSREYNMTFNTTYNETYNTTYNTSGGSGGSSSSGSGGSGWGGNQGGGGGGGSGGGRPGMPGTGGGGALRTAEVYIPGTTTPSDNAGRARGGGTSNASTMIDQRMQNNITNNIYNPQANALANALVRRATFGRINQAMGVS